ncbi:mycothiol transferase [Actinacidiphila acidipaludis]|uniref:DinB family protein n=1 Tax=Actinacidiphila acidipaludis TaxID=2873382 RepID=A0ABS7Q8L0_9ACTN|nr:DinB family protein [Streptomyces acidipaludis]MBY8878760.1 DinB family protein [Streptomyces acidipaludis]
MNTAELLADAFGRVQEDVHGAVDRLTADELAEPVEPGANTVAWLVWHLTRVQDDHVAEVAGREQVWTADGWHGRLGLPFRPAATGFGHGPQQVAQVRVDDPALLTGYFDAVHAATLEYVKGLRNADLDRIVDERWDPPVSLGARLVSVINDDTQHAGQAAFIRGVLLRRR